MTYLKEIDVKTILITGSAGFIGANLVKRLLITDSPVQIVGLDSVNDYYDVRIKKYRLESLKQVAVAHPDSSYIFVKGNIKVLRHGVLAESLGNLYPSDHCPVISRILIQ